MLRRSGDETISATMAARSPNSFMASSRRTLYPLSRLLRLLICGSGVRPAHKLIQTIRYRHRKLVLSRSLSSSCPTPISGESPAIIREMRINSSKSRSEEHTSELQSHSDLVCRLLLEKKKKKNYKKQTRKTLITENKRHDTDTATNR